jgi:hypothetical protein
MTAGDDPLFGPSSTKPPGAPPALSADAHRPEHSVIEIRHPVGARRSRAGAPHRDALPRRAPRVRGHSYRRFEWKCNDLNEPSKAAARRFGFSCEGLFRQHMWAKGANRDTAWFSMLDSEWVGFRREYDRWLDAANFDAAGTSSRADLAVKSWRRGLGYRIPVVKATWRAVR